MQGRLNDVEGTHLTTSDRLLAVLDLFSAERADWSVDEAASALDIATSTAYRYVNSLNRAGLLTSFGGGRYNLGPAIIRLDRQLRLSDPLVVAAAPEMERLAAQVSSKGVVFLCRLFGEEVMCISQAAIAGSQVALSYERGRPMPLFAGSASRVILANLPARTLRSLHQRDPFAFEAAGFGRNWDEARMALRVMREAGGHVTSGEVDKGMKGVSVPLMAPSGTVLGSLSIAGPRAALGAAATTRFLKALGASAGIIERQLQRLTARAIPLA